MCFRRRRVRVLALAECHAIDGVVLGCHNLGAACGGAMFASCEAERAPELRIAGQEACAECDVANFCGTKPEASPTVGSSLAMHFDICRQECAAARHGFQSKSAGGVFA